MTLTVRRATPQDGEAIAAILNPIIVRGGTTAYEDPLPADYLAAKAGPGPDGRTFAHVAQTASGRIVGVQWIGPWDAHPEIAIIATFVALDAAQGGIGSALFPHTLAAAKAAGYAEIDATIRADNTGGLAYYARQGFRDHSVEKAVPLNDGTPVDRVSKRLPLT